MGRQLRADWRLKAIPLLWRRAEWTCSKAWPRRFGAKGCAVPLACDVTDPEQVADAVRQAEAALGPVERLICSAGGGEKTRIEAFSTDHVQRVIALNVGGAANCIEALLPGMLGRGRGQIVAIGSLAAYRGLPGAAAYCAAKAALGALMGTSEPPRE